MGVLEGENSMVESLIYHYYHTLNENLESI